ncbi:nucleoside 2-deoxyribosyltransferase [Actinoallomurus sp. CA-142502]|uniref:nucleoside 2-deoxyribosyltransferase n=1 Tax=Actinoallomurus sp. CA-142502 TaxID=3239885 RepID=UPI003D8A5E7C
MPLYYVAHRLFAAHDRALGAYVAHELTERVGDQAVFLPFCDTDEENLIADVKGRRLYELDAMRLRRIDGMIAVLHGPSLDDGVCMEIGYATALGVPTVILTTDFQTYSPGPEASAMAFPDPLIETVAATIVRQHRLSAPQLPVDGPDRLSVFLNQNLRTIATAAEHAAEALLAARPIEVPAPLPDAVDGQRLAFIEPSPYLPADLWSQVVDHLLAAGWRVHVSRRFRDQDDPLKTAQSDWNAFCRASLTVVDVRGPETPPGAALLIGASAATGQPVLAAADGWWTFADGREPNWRNLMIQYAVHGRFTNLGEFTNLVQAR